MSTAATPETPASRDVQAHRWLKFYSKGKEGESERDSTATPQHLWCGHHHQLSRAPPLLRIGKPLSNFYRRPITVNGRCYSGGEQAFHGEKFFSVASSDSTLTGPARVELLAHAEKFITCADPMAAKRMGGKGKSGYRLSPQQLAAWDRGGADAVQRQICQAKLDTDPTVVEALVDSGNRPLLHQDNRAKADTPWGGRIDKVTGECVGLNKLGLIWMEMRGSLHDRDPSR